MVNAFVRASLNTELKQALRSDKQSSKDGKDGKEGKDDISALPDTGSWV